MTTEHHTMSGGLDYCRRCDVPPKTRQCQTTGKWSTECRNCGAGTDWHPTRTAACIEWNKMQRRAGK